MQRFVVERLAVVREMEVLKKLHYFGTLDLLPLAKELSLEREINRRLRESGLARSMCPPGGYWGMLFQAAEEWLNRDLHLHMYDVLMAAGETLANPHPGEVRVTEAFRRRESCVPDVATCSLWAMIESARSRVEFLAPTIGAPDAWRLFQSTVRGWVGYCLEEGKIEFHSSAGTLSIGQLYERMANPDGVPNQGLFEPVDELRQEAWDTLNQEFDREQRVGVTNAQRALWDWAGLFGRAKSEGTVKSLSDAIVHAAVCAVWGEMPTRDEVDEAVQRTLERMAPHTTPGIDAFNARAMPRHLAVPREEAAAHVIRRLQEKRTRRLFE